MFLVCNFSKHIKGHYQVFGFLHHILGVVKFNFVPFSTNTTNSDKIMYECQGHSQAMGANSQCFDIFVMKTIKSKQQLRLSPYSPAVFLAFVQISCPSSWRSSKMERNWTCLRHQCFTTNANSLDQNGITPINLAVQKRHVESVQFFAKLS